MNRRKFINTSAALTAVGLLDSNLLFAKSSLLNTIGIQLFSVPKSLSEDFNGTIQKLSQMGYREIEMYGPYSFSAQSAVDRWASITPMLGFSGSGYFGRSAAEVKNIFDENKMKVPSIHTDIETLRTKMNQLGEAAQTLGFTYVVLPQLPAEYRKTLDDYKKSADIFNQIGEQALKAGLRFAYHNHGYGMKEVDGKIPLQVLIESTDPKSVFLEMDLFWTVAGSGDPILYFEKFKGRYKMMHVKNMKPLARFSGDGGDGKQWTALFPNMTTTGEGDLDMPEILRAAKKSGVEHFFVEQDRVDHPDIALKKSIDYLKTL